MCLAMHPLPSMSNLIDHIGLHNVLIASVPLHRPLYLLESLLFSGRDATKAFMGRLYASLLIGVCLVDYLSGFTTHSDIHELAIHYVSRGNGSQFHQVTT